MRHASNRRMGRIFFGFAGRFILFLLAVSVAILIAISIALTGDAAAQQASPSAAPPSSVAPPPTKKPHGKYFEVTVCTYPPEVPKGLVRWAQTENGSLFTSTVGAFWNALPKGATVYFYDPEGPECKRRIPSPKPAATVVEPGMPLAPPSDGHSKGGQPKQAGGEARKKAEKAAAGEAERKKKEAKEAEERRREEADEAEERRREEADEAEERKRKAAKEAEERRREEAEERAEADANERRESAEREKEEAHRQRNSAEARWERGDAVLPPVSYSDVPRTCEPPRKGKVQEARPGFKCMQVDLFWIEQPIEPLREPLAPPEPPPPPQQVSALPPACAPPPDGIAPIRALGVECTQPYERFPTPPPLAPLEEEQLPRVPHSYDGPVPMFAACGECKPEAPPIAASDGCTSMPEDGELTDESCALPKPPKTLSEYMRSEAAMAAAMLTLNMNVELPKDGSRNGIVGGLNRDGIDNPAAQVAMIAVTLGLEVVSFTGKFDKVLKKAIKAGKQLFVKQSSPLAKAFAKELAETYGIHLADGMRANKTIVPYELGQKITERLGGRLHAHHLIEVRMFEKCPALKKLGLNPNLSPSVLLTEEAHRKLHRELSALGNPGSIDELVKFYADAYKDNPNWIEAVKWFLGR